MHDSGFISFFRALAAFALASCIAFAGCRPSAGSSPRGTNRGKSATDTMAMRTECAARYRTLDQLAATAMPEACFAEDVLKDFTAPGGVEVESILSWLPSLRTLRTAMAQECFGATEAAALTSAASLVEPPDDAQLVYFLARFDDELAEKWTPGDPRPVNPLLVLAALKARGTGCGLSSANGCDTDQWLSLEDRFNKTMHHALSASSFSKGDPRIPRSTEDTDKATPWRGLTPTRKSNIRSQYHLDRQALCETLTLRRFVHGSQDHDRSTQPFVDYLETLGPARGSFLHHYSQLVTNKLAAEFGFRKLAILPVYHEPTASEPVVAATDDQRDTRKREPTIDIEDSLQLPPTDDPTRTALQQALQNQYPAAANSGLASLRSTFFDGLVSPALEPPPPIASVVDTGARTDPTPTGPPIVDNDRDDLDDNTDDPCPGDRLNTCVSDNYRIYLRSFTVPDLEPDGDYWADGALSPNGWDDNDKVFVQLRNGLDASRPCEDPSVRCVNKAVSRLKPLDPDALDDASEAPAFRFEEHIRTLEGTSNDITRPMRMDVFLAENGDSEDATLLATYETGDWLRSGYETDRNCRTFEFGTGRSRRGPGMPFSIVLMLVEPGDPDRDGDDPLVTCGR